MKVFLRSSGLLMLAMLACADPDADTRQAVDAGPGEQDAGPRKLSSTGLYTDIGRGEIAPDVRAYTPQGALWSDGASKARWVYLPTGTQIDTDDMDDWRFPVGTKLWKQFDVADQRVETRLLEKTAVRSWTLVAFAWDEDQRDATEVPAGRDNAAGSEHDIPSSEDCRRCHRGVPDIVIGFSAVQLAHSDSMLTLDELVAEERLSSPPTAALTVPGDSTQQAALLYLHANCANCHNRHTIISNVTNIDYWLRVDSLSDVRGTRTYQTLQRDLRRSGNVDASATVTRMNVRGMQGQMPPIASELVDEQGANIVKAFMQTIDPEYVD